jgi:hypothetical protein
MAIPTTGIAPGAPITAATQLQIITAVNAISMLGQVPTVSGTGVTVNPGGAIVASNSPIITVIGAFNSTYDNYRIAWNLPTQSANADLSLRLTSVGTDNTAAQYDYLRGWDGGVAGARTVQMVTASSVWLVSAGQYAGQTNNGYIDLFGPALAQATTGLGQSAVHNPVPNMYTCTTNVYHSAATAFDGFSIFPQSGNISGTIRVYGYGTPPINAAFLNGVETQLVTLTTPPSNVVNAITGWYHTNDYGAVGDGATDDRAAIQAALTAANAAYVATGAGQKVYLPDRVHIVGAVTYNRDDGTTYGAVSLMLYDGVEFFGPGTLRVQASAYGSGALYAIVRSKSGGLTRAKIRDITFDGNRGNQVASTQCGNILLQCTDDVEVIGTRHGNCNGNGILLSGAVGSPAATNLRIRNNDVNGCTSIGIQASQFNGLDIDNNTVANCSDNGIDIYGEDGTTTCHGVNFRITNNRVYGCLVGIFPETVAFGIVANNYCYNNVSAGVHCNRINGAPTGISITNNLLTGGPNGIYITGDMGSIYIRGNTLVGSTTAGIQMGGGGAALSHVFIDGNFIDPSTVNSVALILIASGTTTWSASTIRRTVTQNTNHAYDVVNYASSTAGTVSYDQSNS